MSRKAALCGMAGILILALVVPTLHAQGRTFRLQGLNGGQLGPGELNRGVVIAVVWASWSPRCRDIVDRVNAIERRWGGRARVIMVAFQEEKADALSFLAGQEPLAEVFLDTDGSFSKNYSVTHLPGLLIFKDGTTVFSGRLPDHPDSLITQSLG